MTPQEAIKCEKCLHQSVCEKKTCAECQGSGCDECELYDLYNGVPYIEDCEDFIDADLINRQKAEIERRKNNLFCKVVIDEETMRSITNEKVQEFELDIKSIIADAIKEFVEAFKVKFAKERYRDNYVIDDEMLDNFVKEKVGESNV